MANLIIDKELAAQLESLAQRQGRPIDAILREMVARYAALNDTPPGQFLRDEDIDAPADIQNPAEFRAAVRGMRPLLYEKARAYWARVGDYTRLAMTNRELDEQFWVIDPDGIPRLKADQATYQLPPDPLEAFIGLVEDGPTDLSMSVRETIAARYRDQAHGDSA